MNSLKPTQRLRRSEDIEAELKLAIISGEIPAGSRIRVEEYAERFSASLSPVREALSRLSMSGPVRAEKNRGFHVPELSIHELEELFWLRTQIETRGVRIGIAHGDVAWEADLVAAFHKLYRTDQVTPNPAWESAHREFHLILIQGARMPIMSEFCDRLQNMADRYRVQLETRLNMRDSHSEHREILEAVLAKDADLADKLLSEHHQLTLERVRARFLGA